MGPGDGGEHVEADNVVRMQPDVQQEQAPEDERVRKAREFVPLFCVVVVPLLSSFRIKEMAELRYRTGLISVLSSKIVLYVPSFGYLVFYSLKAVFCTPLANHSNIGSFALRLVAGFFGVLLSINDVISLIDCWHSKKIYCGAAVQWERVIRALFFFGLSIFVLCNKFQALPVRAQGLPPLAGTRSRYENTEVTFPRKTKWNLFCLSYLLSATLYTYVLAIFAEETHIYHAIIERKKNTEHSYLPARGTHSYLPVRRAHSNWIGSKSYNDSPDDESFWDRLLEMVCAATCEFLVVTVSIIIGIICEAGKADPAPTAEPAPPRVRVTFASVATYVFRPIKLAVSAIRNNTKKTFWICGVCLLSVVATGIIIFLDIKKTDPNSWGIKMVFFGFHNLGLLIGTILCLLFFFVGNVPGYNTLAERPEDHNMRVATENLERYLLYFGTTGFFFCAGFGLIHSIYLSFSEYSTVFAINSVIADSASMIQGFAQTVVILHCDMKTNTYGYWFGVPLFCVNFMMFLLDLFDAATLGIYANPVPVGSNVMWTMLVRGLGPFVVFYRFHSMAIIAEVVEHHAHN